MQFIIIWLAHAGVTANEVKRAVLVVMEQPNPLMLLTVG